MNPAALSNDDRLPDACAVWRDPPGPTNCAGFIFVTVEYAGGFREQTTVGGARWALVKRWRFGWGPQ